MLKVEITYNGKKEEFNISPLTQEIQAEVEQYIAYNRLKLIKQNYADFIDPDEMILKHFKMVKNGAFKFKSNAFYEELDDNDNFAYLLYTCLTKGGSVVFKPEIAYWVKHFKAEAIEVYKQLEESLTSAEVKKNIGTKSE